MTPARGDPPIRDCLSPNHDARRPGAAVDMLILHYTGMLDSSGARARLCDPAAKVSAHYLIEEDGRIWRLVPEERRAWHAGVGFWAGEQDVNGRSIGIELANPGHDGGCPPFPEAQMAALEELSRAVLARHPIPRRRVLGHSDVAPARKQDPGEHFDWARLARAGIGLWPEEDAEGVIGGVLWLGTSGKEVRSLQTELARFGYGLAVTGSYDEPTAAVVRAFQRHFRPSQVDGVADTQTCRRLASLLASPAFRAP